MGLAVANAWKRDRHGSEVSRATNGKLVLSCECVQWWWWGKRAGSRFRFQWAPADHDGEGVIPLCGEREEAWAQPSGFIKLVEESELMGTSAGQTRQPGGQRVRLKSAYARSYEKCRRIEIGMKPKTYFLYHSSIQTDRCKRNGSDVVWSDLPWSMFILSWRWCQREHTATLRGSWRRGLYWGFLEEQL